MRLLRAGTWEELASLPAPKLLRQPCFSPDGTQLALPGEKSGVELWDLRRLRQSLADLGVDWEGAPILPRPEVILQKPWEIRVDAGVVYGYAPGLSHRPERHLDLLDE